MPFYVVKLIVFGVYLSDFGSTFHGDRVIFCPNGKYKVYFVYPWDLEKVNNNGFVQKRFLLSKGFTPACGAVYLPGARS